MKKAAIFSITAFYLLLTTGMFVCIVHCAAEKFLTKPAMTMAGADMHMHGAKKHCDDGKDCDCCKKHGTYVVKENLKPSFELQFTQTAVLVHQQLIVGYINYNVSISHALWFNGKAPPGKSGRSISILFRSLQV